MEQSKVTVRSKVTKNREITKKKKNIKSKTANVSSTSSPDNTSIKLANSSAEFDPNQIKSKNTKLSLRTSIDTSSSGDKEAEKIHCQETITTCDEMVDNFWVTAWTICSERFVACNVSLLVTLELRDTWLRVVETEWLDFERTGEIIPSRIFKPDSPPLPLAFDSWSRGAIEFLPALRRESVLDPFLRSADEIDQITDITTPVQSNTITKLSDEGQAKPSKSVLIDTMKRRRSITSPNVPISAPITNNEFKGDTEDFRVYKTTTAESTGEASSNWYYSGHEEEYKPPRIESPVKYLQSLETLFTVPDYEIGDSSTSGKTNATLKRFGVKLFSPSQCGAQGGKGSGVYRLFNESTTEVIQRTRPDYQRKGNTFSTREDDIAKIKADYNADSDHVIGILSPRNLQSLQKVNENYSELQIQAKHWNNYGNVAKHRGTIHEIPAPLLLPLNHIDKSSILRHEGVRYLDAHKHSGAPDTVLDEVTLEDYELFEKLVAQEQLHLEGQTRREKIVHRRKTGYIRVKANESDIGVLHDSYSDISLHDKRAFINKQKSTIRRYSMFGHHEDQIKDV